MIDSVMFWNEPNNKSHWDPEIDPDWSQFATMINMAGQAVADVNPAMTRVLGGISPIDAGFIENLKAKGVLDNVDVVGAGCRPGEQPVDPRRLDVDHWPSLICAKLA